MKRSINSIAVYCGSSPGSDPAFMNAARHVGQVLAMRDVQLIFGGSDVGLMGAVADGALSAGGSVMGVTTRALDAKGITHQGLTRLEVLDDMHARKRRMSDVADAFVMLPGGLGTFDEFFEMAAWTQLDIQKKPCGALNINGYFDPLVALIDTAVTQRFVRVEHASLISISDDVAVLLDELDRWQPVHVDKWIDRG